MVWDLFDLVGLVQNYFPVPLGLSRVHLRGSWNGLPSELLFVPFRMPGEWSSGRIVSRHDQDSLQRKGGCRMIQEM